MEATWLRRQVQETVDRLLAGRDSIKVLEAGCGSILFLRFPEPAHVTGVDISKKQLDRNPRLHERIVGDLQTCELPREAFDVVVCWNVLEHLPQPELAVTRLAAALGPGGVLVLACPNPRSLRALATRLTPLWFHVWFYKSVLGYKAAGEDDVGPFPTIMSRSIAPEALCQLAQSCGLEVELKLLAKGNWWWSKSSIARRAVEGTVDGVGRALRLLTMGRYDGDLAQTRLVFRKTVIRP